MGSALQPPLLRAVTKLGNAGPSGSPELVALRTGRLWLAVGVLNIGLGVSELLLGHNRRAQGAFYACLGFAYVAFAAYNFSRYRSLRNASTA